MISRVVEIASEAFLSLHLKQLVVERKDQPKATVPIEDLGVLILDHPAIVISQRLLSALAEGEVAVVVSDEKHLPAGLMLPTEGHSVHSEVLRMQIAVAEPKRKRAWQTIVVAKIKAQERLARSRTGRSHGLDRLAKGVLSGDSANAEGLAAAVYFREVFGPDFQRERGAGGANALLNYGYAVLRAAVARSVVGAGLHPALGLHHHNRYNAFCLADDLMEPLRPVVDRLALNWVEVSGEPDDLTPDAKRHMAQVLTENVTVKGRSLPLVVSLESYAAGLRRWLADEIRKLEIPLA